MTRGARTAVGVDVGGTNIRAARVDPSGHIEQHVIEPVEAGRAAFTAQILRLIGTVKGNDSACAGIGIPGRVDATIGAILSAGYLDIAGLDLAEMVRDTLGLRIRVENDATMALIAEASLRASAANGLTLMVTVGTGIGGAILQDGAPWYGGGLSGQFGHLVVASDGTPCNCGRRGCIETFSSGTALGHLIRQAGLPQNLPARALMDRAAAGDQDAVQVLAAWTAPMQRALQTLAAAFDPDLILIGGGLGQVIVTALAQTGQDSAWFRLPIEAARLGDDAGVIGAGLRCFQALES